MSARPRLSLCLEMVFPDLPFLERMAEAARLGFDAVEFWDWRDKDLPRLRDEAVRLGLDIAAMSGNRKHSLIHPAERRGLVEEMDQVFDAAERLGCRNLMLLSDVLEADGSGRAAPGLSREEKQESLVEGLAALARGIDGRVLTLLLEPLNTVLDHRGCFLDSSEAGFAVIERVSHPRVRLLYDIYHMSMMGEDAAAVIDSRAPWIGYYHAADMPGRHQPGSGRIDWARIRQALARQQYDGFVGMEFSPLGSSDQAVRRSREAFA